MMSIVARSACVADGRSDAVPDDVVARGQTAAEKFLFRWRGEADPRHVKAIDTYWICTAEHGLNVHHLHRPRDGNTTGADGGAAPLLGRGRARARSTAALLPMQKPMLAEVAAMGDPQRWG